MAKAVSVPVDSEAKTSANTSSANVSQEVKAEKPKKWIMLIDLWTEAKIHGINRATDRKGLQDNNAQNRENFNSTFTNSIVLRPIYKITDTTSVAIGQDLEHTFGSAANSGNSDGNGKFIFYDTYLQVAESNLATMGNVTLRGYLRPYIPTSEMSRNPVSGKYTTIRAGLTASAPIGGGFKVGYSLEPRYHFQKNAIYEKLNADGGIADSIATEHYRLKHWASLEYESGKFSGYQRLGLRSLYFHEIPEGKSFKGYKEGSAPQIDNLYVETALGYQLLNNFAMNLGIYTENHNIRASNFKFYDDKAYLYFAEGIVTF